MKYRKLEIVPDKGLAAEKKEKKKASTFPPRKAPKTPEEREQMKEALLKASDNGTKPLPDIPTQDESEKTKKLLEAPDEIIAKGIQTMLEKDRGAED